MYLRSIRSKIKILLIEGILHSVAVFPFITYYVLNKSSVANPREVAVNVRNTTLKKFDPRAIKHTTDHTFDLFTEVANIVCPPMSQSKRPRGPHTAYIISVYKVFDGDDSEKFEKHWLYWTGQLHKIRILSL